jgi:hypothetical protein
VRKRWWSTFAGCVVPLFFVPVLPAVVATALVCTESSQWCVLCVGATSVNFVVWCVWRYAMNHLRPPTRVANVAYPHPAAPALSSRSEDVKGWWAEWAFEEQSQGVHTLVVYMPPQVRFFRNNIECRVRSAPRNGTILATHNSLTSHSSLSASPLQPWQPCPTPWPRDACACLNARLRVYRPGRKWSLRLSCKKR